MDEWEPHDVEPEAQPSEHHEEESESSRRHDDEGPEWECNICFDAVKIESSCVTTCGHLYCWPCLHKWIDTFREKTSPPVCPVCKNVLSADKIIPIFGRGASSESDPRLHPDAVPQRPAPPPREEAPPPQRFAAFPGGFSFSAGFFGPGIMAFGGGPAFAQGPGMPELTPEQRRTQQFLSQIMLFLGCAVLASLLLT